jgi:hypothetical protein
MPRGLSDDLVLAVRAEIDAAPDSRTRARIVESYAADAGVSKQALYARLRASGYSSGRTKRSDAGKRRLPVNNEQLDKIARIMLESESRKYGVMLPAYRAIEIAEDPANAIIQPGTVHPHTLQRYLRSVAASKTDLATPTPHTRMRSLYPNHVHQVDASVCAQWYLKPDNSIGTQTPLLDCGYKNKPGKPRAIKRWIVTDHYSGAFFVWYTEGETTRDVLQVLYAAWATKDFAESITRAHLGPDDTGFENRFPFHGLPDLLVSDQVGCLKSTIATKVFADLGVNVWKPLPGNSRAKGSVEGMMARWEADFETGLRIESATSLDQLNAWALRRATIVNATRIHTRTNATRTEVWLRDLRADKLREVPDFPLYKSLVSFPTQTRHVNGDGTFTVAPPPQLRELYSEPFTYRHPDSRVYGTTIEVRISFYDYPRITATSRRFNEAVDLMPIRIDAAGFPEFAATWGESFTSAAHTPTQRKVAELEQISLTAGPEIVPVTPAAIRVHTGNDPVHLFDAPAGAAFQTPATEERIMVDRITAKKRILTAAQVAAIADLPDDARELLDSIPDLLLEEHVNQIIDFVNARTIHQPIAEAL